MRFKAIFLTLTGIMIMITEIARGEGEMMNHHKFRNGFDMEWMVDGDHITFKLKVRTQGWVAIGFTPTAHPEDMHDADIIMAGAGSGGTGYLVDAYASSNAAPDVDAKNNVELVDAMEENGLTTVTFKRMLASSDPKDRSIGAGVTGMIYAFGGTDLNGKPQAYPDYHNNNRGHMPVILIPETPTPPPDDMMNHHKFRNGFDMEWMVDGDYITFKLKVRTQGWVAIGFTPTAHPEDMHDADIIMAGVGSGGTGYLVDAYASSNTAPDVDAKNNVELVDAMEENGLTTVTFKRMLASSDPKDRNIGSGVTGMIYAFGGADLNGKPQAYPDYHNNNRGHMPVILIPETPSPPPGEMMNHHNFRNGFDMEWMVDGDYITFKLKVRTQGWVAIGFTPTADPHDMIDADIIMAGVTSGGTKYLVDGHAHNNTVPDVDTTNDVELIDAMEENGLTTVTFKRMLASSEKRDKAIGPGITGMIYAFGGADLNGDPGEVDYHNTNRGHMPVILIPETPTPHEDDGDEVDEDEHENGHDDLDLPHHANLGDGKIQLRWGWVIEDNIIFFEATAETIGWFGIGFSPHHDMTNADIVICGVNEDGAYAYDTFGVGNMVPKLDESQDVEAVSGQENGTHTTVRFKRNITSTDKFDRSIQDEEIYIIWALGHHDMSSGPNSAYYHFGNRGEYETNILQGSGGDDADDDEHDDDDDHEEQKSHSGKATLSPDGNVVLQWAVSKDSIYLQVSAPTDGWVGVGFSPGKNMKRADIIMSGIKDAVPYVFDMFAPRNTLPKNDRNQNVEILGAVEEGNQTIVLLKRPLRRSERRIDRNIMKGMTNIIWAYGASDVDGIPVRSNYHHRNRGVMEVQLIPRMNG